ncbi:MAG TPA: hypothetical protein VGM75_36940 [Pseudonocardiaceae bacterium]
MRQESAEGIRTVFGLDQLSLPTDAGRTLWHGWTTKQHLATEQGQKSLSLAVTAGKRGDSPQFQVMVGHSR